MYKRACSIIVILAGVCILIFTFLDLAGVGLLINQGVCMDTQGNIYIGKRGKVTVYDMNGDQLRTFSPGTSRGYELALQNDLLYVGVAPKIFVLNLEGKQVGEEDYTRERMESLKADGDATDPYNVAILWNPLYYKVTELSDHSSRVILHTPTIEFIACILFILSISAFVISCILLQMKKRS